MIGTLSIIVYDEAELLQNNRPFLVPIPTYLPTTLEQTSSIGWTQPHPQPHPQPQPGLSK